MICWNRNESIPPEIRYQWLKQTYPLAHILLVEDEDYDQDDSKLWAKLTIQWLGFKPDAVFTSEEYGDTWAKCLKTTHVMVDRKRENRPISGTMIRKNPYKYWEYMLPVVRAYFVKKICIVGAESTGKTTLSQAAFMIPIGQFQILSFATSQTQAAPVINPNTSTIDIGASLKYERPIRIKEPRDKRAGTKYFFIIHSFR